MIEVSWDRNLKRKIWHFVITNLLIIGGVPTLWSLSLKEGESYIIHVSPTTCCCWNLLNFTHPYILITADKVSHFPRYCFGISQISDVSGLVLKLNILHNTSGFWYVTQNTITNGNHFKTAVRNSWNNAIAIIAFQVYWSLNKVLAVVQFQKD